MYVRLGLAIFPKNSVVFNYLKPTELKPNCSENSKQTSREKAEKILAAAKKQRLQSAKDC